jgi:hypothetical protein
MFGLGADPGDAVGFDDIGELGVLRQEAVARMDRVGLVISAAEMIAATLR